MNTKSLFTKSFIFIFLSVISLSAFADEDYVKIISLSPNNDKPLLVDSNVKIEVEVEYNLQSANTASVVMVIQRAETGFMPLANEADIVLKGKGTVKLSKEIKIPDTRALQIFLPLTPEGNNSTSTVGLRMYKVIKK